jgi:hypothetical protein
MSKTDKLLNSMRQMTAKVTPIATEMILPNNSGDHVQSIKLNAPIKNEDLANKKYVDDEIAAIDLTPYAKLDGTNQPFTGNLNISETAAEIKLTDTNDTRLVRVATSNEANLYNEVAVVAPNGGTGGTISYAGGYTIHTFTSDGNFVIDSGRDCEWLIVAGGGGGGASRAGGGGAGGMQSGSGNLAANTYAVVIGAGGNGGTYPPFVVGTQGGTSSFNGTSSTGGGYGSNDGGAAGNGGSGGGGGTKGTGAAGEGNDGGNGAGAPHYGAGGGGGKNAVGGAGTTTVGGNGGIGADCNGTT